MMQRIMVLKTQLILHQPKKYTPPKYLLRLVKEIRNTSSVIMILVMEIFNNKNHKMMH